MADHEERKESHLWVCKLPCNIECTYNCHDDVMTFERDGRTRLFSMPYLVTDEFAPLFTYSASEPRTGKQFHVNWTLLFPCLPNGGYQSFLLFVDVDVIKDLAEFGGMLENVRNEMNGGLISLWKRIHKEGPALKRDAISRKRKADNCIDQECEHKKQLILLSERLNNVTEKLDRVDKRLDEVVEQTDVILALVRGK